MTDLLELYRAADVAGVTVDAFRLDSRESIALQDGDGSCYIAIDPFKLESIADEKTKLAHELGHCVTGSFYNRYSTSDVRQQHENRADKWAIRKMISEKELDAAVADGHTELWDLAEHFGVTEDFMRKVVCWYKYGSLAVDAFLPASL